MNKKILTILIVLSISMPALAQPGNVEAYEGHWKELFKNNKQDELKQAIGIVVKKDAKNEETMLLAYNWAKQLGLKDIEQQIVDGLPFYKQNGQLAFQVRFSKLMQLDRKDAIAEIPVMLDDFPGMPVPAKHMLIAGFVATTCADREYKKALALVEKYDPKTPLHYCSIAKLMIQNNDSIEIAIGLLEKELEIIQSTSIDVFESLQANKNSLSNMANLAYAQGLEKVGRFEEAIDIYEPLFLNRPTLENPATENYLAALFETKKYTELFNASSLLAKSGYWSDLIIKSMENSLSYLGKSKTEIKSTLNEFEKQADKKGMDVLKASSISIPAPPFTIKKTNCSALSLSGMKGKVIILDFWATWCSPCIAAFPGIQRVYERYRSNPDVLILAINAEELGSAEEVTSKSLQQKQKKMTDFLGTKNYTFPSYYDNDNMSAKYQINSLPTTVFIDKQGNIRFLNVQAGSEPELVRKWSERIDFLLSDN